MLFGPRLDTHIHTCICMYVNMCMHMFIYTYVYTCMSGAPSIFSTPIVSWPRGLANLIYMVEGGALIWPVAVTLLDTILHQRGQHDNDGAATLPHHLGTETQVSSILTSLGPGWPWLATRAPTPWKSPPSKSPPARSLRWYVTVGPVWLCRLASEGRAQSGDGKDTS